MRELKFRVWHPDDYRIYYFSNFAEIVDWQRGDEYRLENEEGRMVNYMQYTGLKDKNGVEIYEGDILLGYCVYPECNIFESKLIGEVYYSNRGTWDCYSYILGGFNEQVEVIGNIHEHKHLLEVE